MSARHFEEASMAKDYVQFRPKYPVDMYQTILRYCEEGGAGKDLALDVACGSGQSAGPLTRYFDHVIGLDISAAQIEEGKKVHPDIDFQCGPAEDLSFLQDDSVDLITCAAGFHWLDAPSFMAEAHRVLKPNGVFVAIAYNRGYFDNDEATKKYIKFYSETILEYWAPFQQETFTSCQDLRLQGFWDIYFDVKLPIRDIIRNKDITICKKMKLSEFVGFLRSLSGCNKYLKQNPDGTALHKWHKEMISIYNRDKEMPEDDPEVVFTWSMLILMGRK